jgi:hypothetical protein
VNNVRFGVGDGTPRAIFEDAGSSTRWEIDNSSGKFRIFTPGLERLTIDNTYFGTVVIGTGLLGQGDLQVSGTIKLGVLESPGSQGPLCLNSGVIAECSSSIRYKKDLLPFAGGLDILSRLRPITFTWKDHPGRDLGLGAEEVEKVEPLLTFRNAKGEIEGVKYDKLTVVLINSIKEQQGEIQQERAQIKQQQNQLETMKRANAALSMRLQAIEKRLRRRGDSALPRR